MSDRYATTARVIGKLAFVLFAGLVGLLQVSQLRDLWTPIDGTIERIQLSRRGGSCSVTVRDFEQGQTSYVMDPRTCSARVGDHIHKKAWSIDVRAGDASYRQVATTFGNVMGSAAFAGSALVVALSMVVPLLWRLIRPRTIR